MDSKDISVNREYKDRLFSFILGARRTGHGRWNYTMQ